MKTDNTTAFGLWKFAEEYLDAARIVGSSLRHEISAPHYYLLGHSMELSLKAFLLAKGVSVYELKSRQISHDLEMAYERSKDMGFKEVVSILPEEEYSLRLLNKTYSRKEHEYIVVGYREWPQPDVVQSFIAKVLDAIRELCYLATPIDENA